MPWNAILGQNARNLLYIWGKDFWKYKNLADSKLKTKKFLSDHKVAIPETFAVLKTYEDLEKYSFETFPTPSVIKPNNGYGWKGILIIDEKNQAGNFVTNTWIVLSPKELRSHITLALEGFFSLSWSRDKVFIEKKIVLAPEIELLGSFWLPDIRVIVYNNIPVMAMMRIPTLESGWKANIHSGACAVWIDIASGKLTYISYHGRQIKTIPGIGDIRGLILPNWENILELAVKVQFISAIPFLGCDIVLDAVAWALILEINVRPGLEIQNVNLSPLLSRLKRIEGINVQSVKKWVRIGRDLFWGSIEDRVENISWKKIVWLKEYLSFEFHDKKYNYVADIRPSLSKNILDIWFARDILGIDIDHKKQIRLETILLETKRVLIFSLEELWEEKMILGLWALKWFFIDPFKYKKWETPFLSLGDISKSKNSLITQTQKSQILSLDAELRKIEKQIPILSLITPTNIDTEKKKFVESEWNYIPKFEYRSWDKDIKILFHQLNAIEIPDIPLSKLYIAKKEEIFIKLSLLNAVQDQKEEDITRFSEKLYGSISNEYFEYAKKILAGKNEIYQEEKYLSPNDIAAEVKKFNHIYKIKLRFKVWQQTARFMMKWSTLMMRNDAKIWKKEFRSIIAHEIEWHYLRTYNAESLPYTLLQKGTAWYLETEEGIAIYNQNRFLWIKDVKYYGIFERYYFLHYAEKHSYKGLIEKMIEYYKQDYERVFHYMLRLKRWLRDVSKNGIFMKDVVYLSGYKKVEEFLAWWWLLEDLYVGKISIADLEELKNHDFFVLQKKKCITPFFLS